MNNGAGMSEYTAIADISESLIQLLRSNMSDLINPDSILLISPADIHSEDVRVSLFLCNIQENPHMKNMAPKADGTEKMGYPGLCLNLYYLLTTYASAPPPDRTDRSLEEHRVMGRAMRTLHDNPILFGVNLKGGLAGSSEHFKVIMCPMSSDEQYRLWSSFPNRSFRASVLYSVTSVSLGGQGGVSPSRERKI